MNGKTSHRRSQPLYFTCRDRGPRNVANRAEVAFGSLLWRTRAFVVIPVLTQAFRARTGLRVIYECRDSRPVHSLVTRSAFGLLTGLLVTAHTGVASAAVAPRMGARDGRPLTEASPQPVKIFLQGDGGQLIPGSDDSRRNRSALLRDLGLGLTELEAFGGSVDQWKQLKRCVERQFDGFAVDVVDERPSGPHVLAMVGGTPDRLRLPQTVGGLAPHGRRVLRNAVLFVFSGAHQTSAGLCETTAHEIGHVLGLDHSRLCSDVMSYRSCGPKKFRNIESACGEWSARRCSDGSRSQNSVATLARLVGPSHEPSPPLVASTSRLTVRVGSTPHASQTLIVEVDAADPQGIRDVDLLWYDERVRRLRCGDANPDQPYTCTRRGSKYTFALQRGGGTARFVARVTDGRGQTTRTQIFNLRG